MNYSMPDYNNCLVNLSNSILKAFGNQFWILTKEDVIERKLFGIGKEHELFRDMLGDYICISVSDAAVFLTHEEMRLTPGDHAGLTQAELDIPLIAVF